MARQDADTRQQDATLARDQEQHATQVRAAYDRLACGDIAGLAPFLNVHAVAHEYRGTRRHATYQGRRAILARLEGLAPSYWDTVRVRVHTVAASGFLTAAIATWQGTSRVTGRAYVIHHVLVVRVAGRQFTEVWVIQDDAEEVTHDHQPYE